ncbi:MAG: hypothetical protein ACKVII_08855, partial [Planctomycetales bacterium]
TFYQTGDFLRRVAIPGKLQYPFLGLRKSIRDCVPFFSLRDNCAWRKAPFVRECVEGVGVRRPLRGNAPSLVVDQFVSTHLEQQAFEAIKACDFLPVRMVGDLPVKSSEY